MAFRKASSLVYDRLSFEATVSNAKELFKAKFRLYVNYRNEN